MDDRIYRFIIPGGIFLIAYCGLLILYPGISFLGILKLFALQGIEGLGVAIFGGSIIMVIIGYICSTFGYRRVIKKLSTQNRQETHLKRSSIK